MKNPKATKSTNLAKIWYSQLSKEKQNKMIDEWSESGFEEWEGYLCEFIQWEMI